MVDVPSVEVVGDAVRLNLIDATRDLPCMGDLNGDLHVDGADLAIMLGQWNQSGGTSDLNGDGLIDGADLALLLGRWGTCSN